MSDLISRKALLEAFKVDQNAEYYNLGEAMELVISAPAIEKNVKCSIHPDAPHGFCRDASHTANRYVCECEGWTPPPQPQTVKDALEKAASICDARAKYMKEMIMQDVVVGKADTGAMVCADAIRALIEKE